MQIAFCDEFSRMSGFLEFLLENIDYFLSFSVPKIINQTYLNQTSNLKKT